MDKNKIRILLVDDDQGDHVFLRALLNRIDSDRYELDWVPSFGEALEHFEQNVHDLFFLDYYLEDRDGLELLREAKRLGVTAPIIILTGRGSRTLDVEAMRAGAADYLVKGEIEPDVLERTIRYVLEGGRSIQELQQRTERLRELVEGVPVALYRVAADGTDAEVNPALRALLGSPDTASLIEGYAPSLFVAPADKDAFLRELQDDRVVRSFTTELTRTDGVRVEVTHAAQMRPAEGEGAAVIEGAITQKQAGGGPGAGANARFSTLFRTLDQPGIVADVEANITDANPAAIELLQSSAADLAGRPLLELFAEPERVGVQGVIDAMTSGELDHRRGKRRLVGAGGTTSEADVVFQLARDPENGRPDSILVLLGAAG